VATIVVVVAPFLPNQDLFWSFFALNLVMFLSAYLPVFPAFLKLRKIDPNRERPFKVSGNNFVLTVLAILPMILIITSIVFIAVPFSFDKQTLMDTLPITIGSIIFYIIGEILIRNSGKENNDKTNKGEIL
ncbi:MAG: hypothetical protein ACRC92_04905, partial [Peptostreptococcaceae bacterium]